MGTLTQVFGWVIAVFLGLLELLILFWLWRNPRVLEGLISEPGKDKASLSRFQFLVFTFVIAMSFYLIVISATPPAFPEVPAGVWGLLGVSGGSYVVSKGIQLGRGTP